MLPILTCEVPRAPLHRGGLQAMTIECPIDHLDVMINQEYKKYFYSKLITSDVNIPVLKTD